jgi:trehalose-6-phosphatase
VRAPVTIYPRSRAPRNCPVPNRRRATEVMPASAADRGSALARWLEGAGDALVVTFGDDVRDAPLHAFARSLRGISVAVGQRSCGAEVVLRSPVQVDRFLEWLGRDWAARAGAAAFGRRVRRRRALSSATPATPSPRASPR